MDKNINQPDFPHTGDAFEKFDKQRVFDGMTSFEIWEHGVLWADRTNPKSKERPAEAPASSGHTEASLDEILQYYFPDDYYEVQRKKTIPLINRYVDGKLSQLSKELQETRAENERLKEVIENDGAFDAGFDHGVAADTQGLEELRTLARKVSPAYSQLQFFQEGYRNGSASISECIAAGDDFIKALNELDAALSTNLKDR